MSGVISRSSKRCNCGSRARKVKLKSTTSLTPPLDFALLLLLLPPAS
jgi:hypothetical protein